MKNFILLLITSIIYISTSTAQELNNENYCIETPQMVEEHNCYLKALGGVNFISTRWRPRNIQPGYFFSGALGYHYNNEIRLETEFSRRSNTYISYDGYWDFASVNSEISSCMFNALWDIPKDQSLSFYNFKPFVGVGLGADFHDSITPYFAWQFIFGVKRTITKKIDLSLEYIVHRSSQSIALGFFFKFDPQSGYRKNKTSL